MGVSAIGIQVVSIPTVPICTNRTPQLLDDEKSPIVIIAKSLVIASKSFAYIYLNCRLRGHAFSLVKKAVTDEKEHHTPEGIKGGFCN